jgi:hypothetical protein
MTDERDPLLERLFAESRSEPADNAFCERVMASVEKRRRNVFAGRMAIVALLLLSELLLSAPLQNSFGIITEALGGALVPVTNEWLAMAVEPVNSIAGVIGVILLGLLAVYRRVVR